MEVGLPRRRAAEVSDVDEVVLLLSRRQVQRLSCLHASMRRKMQGRGHSLTKLIIRLVVRYRQL